MVLDAWGRRRWVLALAVLLTFGFVFAQARFGLFTADRTVDSYSYYFASRALAAGASPYDSAALQALAPAEVDFVFPYLYPPLLAFLWTPLTALDPFQAHQAVMLGSMLLAMLNLALLWSLVRPSCHAGAWFLALTLLHAVCGPLVSTVRLGQINVLLGTLVLLALLHERSNHPTRAGFFLALAILIKVTPLVYLVDLVIRGRWRTVGSCALSGGALVVVTIPFIGPRPWGEFVSHALEPLPFNPPISLKGLLDAVGASLDADRGIVIAVVLGGLTAVLWRLMRRLPALRRETEDATAAWGMLTLFALLASPLTWHHHYYLALLPFAYFVPRAFERGGRSRLVWAAAALAVLLRYPGALHPVKPLATLVTFFLV